MFSLLPLRLFHKLREKKYREKKQNKVNRTAKTEQTIKSKQAIKSWITGIISGYIRYFTIQTGYIPSHHIRNFIYKYVLLIEMGHYSIIYFGAEIRDSFKLRIGEGSIIGDKSILDARNGIFIGKNVNFSSNVSIWTEQHDHKDPLFRCNSDENFKVVIEDRVWIGPNVTILHSVTIHEGAVVAAGAVVTKDVEPFSIVAGIPAKKIGERNKNLSYQLNGRHVPFY